MRIALAALLLSSAAAHAESRYQLQVGVSGEGFIGSGPFIHGTAFSVGLEDGSSVWLLGVGFNVGHFQAVSSGQTLADGSLSYTTYQATAVSASLMPGYRRYLTGFESGFAPLVEGRLTLGAAYTHADVAQPFVSSTALSLGTTAGFGGEARFGDHFAVNAVVYAQLGVDRTSGNGPTLYSESFGLGSSATILLRF